MFWEKQSRQLILRGLCLDGADVNILGRRNLVVVQHVMLERSSKHPHGTLTFNQDSTTVPDVDLFMILLQ